MKAPKTTEQKYIKAPCIDCGGHQFVMWGSIMAWPRKYKCIACGKITR